MFYLKTMIYLHKITLFCLVFFPSLLFGQTEPTIGVCAGGSFTVCLQDSTYDLCTRIVVSNPRPIDSFVIRWTDNGPNKTLAGSNQPPDQRFIYNLGDFYNRSCDLEKEVRVTLLTYYPNSPRANNSSIITFLNPPKPSISLRGNLCANETISFISNPCPSNVKVVEWDYGDGVRDASGTHIYKNQGVYEVKLTVENPCGKRSVSQTVNIIGLPKAKAEIISGVQVVNGENIVCLSGGGTVQLQGKNSENTTRFRWTVTPTTGTTFLPKIDTCCPILRFTTAGSHTVTLEADNECRKPSRETLTFKVLAAQSLSLPRQDDACLPVNYRVTPIAGATYERIFNGTSAGNFDPNAGFNAGFGEHIIVAKLNNECGNQERRDTFKITESVAVQITSERGKTLCVNTSITLTANVPDGRWEGQDLSPTGVFTPKTDGRFTLTYARGGGVCEKKDTIIYVVVKAVALSLNPQNDECQSFTYRPMPILPNAIYAFDGVVFNPNDGIQAGLGLHTILVTLENACGKQEMRDTFTVAQAEVIKINTPRGQTVCSGKNIALSATPAGGTWSGQFVTASGSFTPQSAGTFLLTYTTGSGSCLQKDTISFVVLGTVSLRLNPQDNQCLPFKYRPSPIIPEAEYRLNGTVFNPNEGIDIPVGTHTIAASLKNICDSSRESITFQVTGLPIIDLKITDTVVCFQDNVLILKASASTNDGVWRGTGVERDTFLPQKAGFGTFQLTYSAGGVGCVAERSIAVKVIGVPVKTGLNDLTICDPQRASAVPLSGGSPAGGQYRLSSPTGAVITAVTPSVLGVGTHRIYYVVTDSTTSSLTCPSYAFFTVKIFGRPNGGIQSDSIKCTDTPLSMQASGGDIFAWDLGDNATKQGANIEHSYARAGNYTVRLIVASEAGCRDTLFKSIKIVAPANAVPSPKDTIVCHGGSVAYRIVSGQAESYTWFRDGVEVAKGIQPTPIGFENLEQNNKTYTLSLSMGVSVCPSQTQTMTITVRPKVKSVISASKSRICSNEPVQFAPNLSRGHIARWYWDLGNGVTSRDSAPPKMVYQTDTAVRFIKIQLIVEDTLCAIDTSSIQIEVIPLSTRAFLNVEQTRVCQGLPIRFINQSSRFANIIWRFGDDSPPSSDSIAVHIFKQIGTFTVALEAYNICGGYAKDSQRITVLPSPQLDSLTYKLVEKCAETRAQFKGHIKNNQPSVYTWHFSNGDSTQAAEPVVDFKTGGIYTARLTVLFASNGCFAQDSIRFSLKNPLVLKIDTLTPDNCGDNKGVIVVETTGGNQPYQYAVNDANFQFDKPLFRNLRGRETYNIFVKDAVGCTQATKTYLDGRPALEVSLGLDLRIDLGDSVLIKAETNFKSTKNTFRWLDTEGVRCADCAASSVRPKRTQTYRVLAKDSFNCEALDTVLVEVIVKRLIAMPNVFSPDDSGHNDKLFPSGGLGVEKVNYLRVYDQNGVLVYEKLDFQPNDATVGWNGAFKNQALVPQTVTYVMEALFYDDEKKIYKGNVLLIK